ncbi:MAG TPA: DUF1343 domain-containing protein [Gemmatimonadaceae bacterium]|nr:DUF1343 domain-containing protein [Gemmatimonadaceae bacterium]
MHPVSRIASPAALAGLALAAACAHRPPVVSGPSVATGGVVPGVEVLLQDSLGLLRGKRVGLITNPSGRDRRGTSTIDLLNHAPGVRLVALFGPEHGLRGVAKAGESVASATDSATGLPIYSLYGATQAPTPEMLRDVDVLVYDIQDVGARVYTFEWTMALAAQAAGKLGKRFIVLDRPDPIRGDRVGGSVLDPRFRSFVGEYPVALRYGLTPGELLRYLVGTGQVTADVTVVPMHGWRRSMWMDETGIPWINPSPNLRTVDATLLYPGTVFFEGTNVTEGRGTEAPFQLIGADWLTDAGAIAGEMNAMALPGVRFDSTSRTIEPGYKFGGETIPMIRISVTDRNAVRPVDVGVRLLRAIYARHGAQWQWRTSHIDRLAGTDALRQAVERGSVDALLQDWNAQAARWQAEARAYWLY